MRSALRTTITTLVTIFALAALGEDAPIPKKDEPIERREHIRVQSKAGELLYHATIIKRTSESLDETIVLVRDEGFMDVVMRHTARYDTQTVIERISDVTNRAYVQHSWRTHFTTKTRTETLAQARENEALLMAPVVVKIETNGGGWEGVETSKDDFMEMRRLRHEQRATMSQTLLEALERMRGTFFTTRPGQMFFQLVGRHLLYEADDEEFAPPTSVDVAPAMPHCDFDRAFGYPCNETQMKRVAAAVKEGWELTHY